MKHETLDKAGIVGRSTAIGAGLAGTCAVVFTGLGWIGDGIGLEDEYSNARESIEHEESYEEADHNLVRLEQRLGESCVTLISDYLPGGRLANREEDSVVTDLIENPAQPCGDDRTKTRINFSELLAARSEFNTAEQEVEDSQMTAEQLDAAEEQHESDQAFDGILVGLKLGGGIGVLVGALATGGLILDDFQKKGYLRSPKRELPIDEEEGGSLEELLARGPTNRHDRSSM